MQQLDMFNETYKGGKRDIEPIDYASQIGIYHEIAHIKGVNDLSENGLRMLHYLYLNHSHAEDGFIHAKDLASILGLYDTRDIRKHSNEIEDKTELVIYACQNGYKLASNESEIEAAVRFALAPALTTIKRVIGKSKNKSKAKMMQGYIGNIEKLYGGNAEGQQEIDDDLNQRTVSHLPNTPFKEFVPSVKERIEAYRIKYKK